MGIEPDDQDQLRAKAEAEFARATLKKIMPRPAEKLLHELQVHQIELELQNETLRESQIALEESRDRYIDFYDFAPVGFISLNRDALIAEINLTGALLLGEERRKLLQHRFASRVSPEDRDRWHRYFMTVLQHGGKQTCELRIARGDGSILHVQLDSIRMVKESMGDEVRVVMTDISEHKEAEVRYRFLANHDRLTELPNRELFYDRLSQAISQARRKTDPLAVLFLDLDGFKAINDNYGHEAGDAVLKIVAKRLQICVRDMDTVARLGGDEFAIILNGIGNAADASSVAEKIIQAVSDPMQLPGGIECHIGVSIGIAFYPLNGFEIDKLMSAADAAMYASKTRNKNCYTFCQEQADRQGASEPWINFNSKLVLGVHDIDQQHEKLVAMLNKLVTSLNGAGQTETVSKLLDEFIAFAKLHFDTEDALMDKYQYPESLEHKKVHQSLLNEATYLKNKFLEGGELVVMQRLKDWFLLHVMTYDKPLANYLKQQGIG